MRIIRIVVPTLVLILSITGCNQTEFVPVEDQSIAETPPPAGTVLSAVPETPDASKNYLIYLHGAIVEGQGMRPTHPRYGTYQYAEILQAFAHRGFVVISEARPEGTRPDRFAEHITVQVQRLLDGGVPPEHITVVGFSKGGVIALLASNNVARDRVNWIIQAGCGPWIEKMRDFIPSGRLLSQIDHADDAANSCRDLFARMPAESIVDENLLEIGSGHGAFYTVNAEWLEPAIQWAGK